MTIIKESEAGYSVNELTAIALTNTASCLIKLDKHGCVKRVRVGRKYFYFTNLPKRKREQQLRKRFNSNDITMDIENDAEKIEELKQTIIILLEIIRYQPETQKQLKISIAQNFPKIPPSFVSQICHKYQIQLKKNLKIFLFQRHNSTL